jgi:putative transposase
MKGITLVAFYYRLGYPKHFSSIEHAGTWFADFINWYNYEHPHSGLQYVTPMQKRSGQHISIYADRNRILAQARERNPLRRNKNRIKLYVARTKIA